MPVPSSIIDLSTTAANNSPSGSESPTTTDNYLRALAAFIAQQRAAFGGAADADIPAGFPTFAEIVGQASNSGTTSGTSTAYILAPSSAIAAYTARMSFWVIFHTASGASPTLTISGLSSPPALVKQDYTGAYVAIAADDIPAGHSSRVTLLSATQALVEDLPPDAPPVETLSTTRIDVASASTIDLTASAPDTRHINITGTTAINGFTVASGLCYFARFDGSLTMTNGAGLVTQTGANIVTQAGDTCLLRATANNVVEVLCYTSVQRLTQASEQVASGTAMDFTGIPAWVQRITVMFDGLSSSGTSRREIRLGTSSGIEATGYLGAMSGAANGTGFLLAGTLASNVSYGTFTLTRMSGNKWVCHGILNTAGAAMDFQAGVKTLSGTLDRLRLTTQNGTDTFDAGTVNIMYEG